MKRGFREVSEDDEEDGLVRARQSGFSDFELESRFGGGTAGGGVEEVLMDEETVKRMLAEERRAELARREKSDVQIDAPPILATGSVSAVDASGSFMDESDVITGLKTPEPPPAAPVTAQPMGIPQPLGPVEGGSPSMASPQSSLQPGDAVVLKNLQAAA
eukprot:2649690-Amphidinium_carterae.1